MQRNGIIIRVGVRDPMQAELVGHIRNFVLLIGLLRKSLERSFFILVEILRRPIEARLNQGAFENFHYAMGVCVAACRGV